MHLMCGGINNNCFIANLLRSVYKLQYIVIYNVYICVFSKYMFSKYMLSKML